MRLLLVEDDPMIGESARQGLRQDGFSVDWVRDGAAAETALRNEVYDPDASISAYRKSKDSKRWKSIRAKGNRIPCSS